ncbi:MAG: Tim44-like domain-containing protein [Methylococcaceae bacterium]|nr:Tim44-like domain-containing protein [Methylococcaceae bacterium]MCI0734566.1 Tim44-like domain-containing protein [Methylococcaceae bacterium]
MKTITSLFIVAVTVAITLAAIPDADAKRFGGGRSFGSKPSYSSPFSRSAMPRQSLSRQQAAAQNESLRNSMSRRGGLMGMLGGLALGGLLGSLLFGGAFENINFLDILVFGAMAFLLYRLFAARARPQNGYRASSSGYGDAGELDRSPDFHLNRAGNSRTFDTDLLFRKDRTTRTEVDSNVKDADFESVAVPEGFDQAAFLNGAKNAYRQLQNAWDRGDLSDIRGLTTDSVFSEIKDQVNQRGSASQTDILKLDAELLDVREMDRQTEASVLFDSILREAVEERPVQVREIWHFVRPLNSSRPTWFLDGIQQLED